MFSLYPYYLRNRRGGKWYSRFQVTEMIEGIFGFGILASETFWGRNIWQAFFLGGLIQVGNFWGYSIQSVDSDGMMNKQTQQSISVVHIFRVISFKAFCKFLRLRNLAWGFWGIKFQSRDFLGGFVGSHRDFFGFLFFAPIRSYPSLEIQSIFSPGGRESLFTRGTCLTFHIYMHGLWLTVVCEMNWNGTK